jgi:DNA modification methylase
VLGPLHKNGEVWEYWRDWLFAARSDGWRFFAQYPWDKLEALPGDFGGRFAPSHEFVFHLNREPKKINKIVPCKRAGTLRSPNDALMGTRNRDGSISAWTHAGRPVQNVKIPDSVIRLSPHKARFGIEKAHPAVYPVSLPQFLMESFSNIGDVVLDPFLGSGTTLLAAGQCGRLACGMDISQDYCDLAIKRWHEQAQAERS